MNPINNILSIIFIICGFVGFLMCATFIIAMIFACLIKNNKVNDWLLDHFVWIITRSIYLMAIGVVGCMAIQ